MINSLDKTSCCPEQDQCCQDIEASVIAKDLKLTSTNSSEVLSSNVGHVSTDTRVTFKRVSYTSRSISAGNKISRVHSSTMSTTRRWSGPGVVGLVSDLDGHGVFGLDLLNQIPGSSDLFGWVNNLDAFVKEQNIGLKEEQIRTKGTGSTDSNRQDYVAAIEKTLNNKSDKEGDKNPSASNGAAGSELFTIRHVLSFSQMGSTK